MKTPLDTYKEMGHQEAIQSCYEFSADMKNSDSFFAFVGKGNTQAFFHNGITERQAIVIAIIMLNRPEIAGLVLNAVELYKSKIQ